MTEQIGLVYVGAQMTELVQASTIACSSAMLEQAWPTCWTCQNVTSQVEFGLNHLTNGEYNVNWKGL